MASHNFLSIPPAAAWNGVDLTAVDPYLLLADSTRFVDYLTAPVAADQCFLTTFELAPVSASNSIDSQLASLKSILANQSADSGAPVGKVVDYWWGNDLVIFGVAVVTMAGLAQLSSQGQGLISRFDVALALRDPRPWWTLPKLDVKASMPIPQQSTSPILLGVVDYGCPFAHESLQCGTSATRVISLWNQGSSGAGANALGIHWTQNDLWRFMQESTDANGILDERACYEKAGLHELQSRYSHGAHMLGLLTGCVPSLSLTQAMNVFPPVLKNWSDEAMRSEVAFIQLPPGYLQGMPRSAYVAHRLMGIKHILDCAGEETGDVVIATSSEIFEGPHDGTTLFERGLDALIEYATNQKKKSLTVLVASGNSANRAVRLKLDRIDPAQEASFLLRTLPGGELPTLVEVWLPQDAEVELTVVAPGHSTPWRLTSAASGNATFTFPSQSEQICSIVATNTIRNSEQSKLILIRVAPTQTADDTATTSPAGDWQIRLRSLSPCGPIWAYVARSFHGIGGKRRSYQSYFPETIAATPYTLGGPKNNTSSRQVHTPTHPEGSLNGLAGGVHAIVVSGYRLSDGERAPYAGMGPNRNGKRDNQILVDASAPSEESVVLHGIRSWGNMSGATFRMGGTSVATPIAARKYAKDRNIDGKRKQSKECEQQIDPSAQIGMETGH